VLDGARLVGVMSERDYARKVILRDKSSKDTTVADIMTSSVVTVTPEHTVPQCMALMDKHGFRHLPVVENGGVIGVLSIRDLLKATVAHHERLIRELETELVTTLNPNVSGY
jgi:CBS domain-containing protein